MLRFFLAVLTRVKASKGDYLLIQLRCVFVQGLGLLVCLSYSLEQKTRMKNPLLAARNTSQAKPLHLQASQRKRRRTQRCIEIDRLVDIIIIRRRRVETTHRHSIIVPQSPVPIVHHKVFGSVPIRAQRRRLQRLWLCHIVGAAAAAAVVVGGKQVQPEALENGICKERCGGRLEVVPRCTGEGGQLPPRAGGGIGVACEDGDEVDELRLDSCYQGLARNIFITATSSSIRFPLIGIGEIGVGEDLPRVDEAHEIPS